MAVALAIQKWRPYLLGQRFIVRTDQQTLKFLLEQRIVQPEYQRWVSKLLGYDFEIQYKPGLDNKAADALSRMAPGPYLNVLSTPNLLDVELIKLELQVDEYLTKIMTDLKQDPDSHPKFSLQQGDLRYKNRMVLSKTSTLLPSILHLYHNTVLEGHSGFLRTYKRMCEELYWQGMKTDTKKFVEECEVCQRNKALAVSLAVLLQPLAVPDRIWEDITMDFVEGLLKSGGQDTIFVVVDRLSKYAHFIPMSHPFTAKTVATTFIKEVVSYTGFLNQLYRIVTRFFSAISGQSYSVFKARSCGGVRPIICKLDGQTEIVNKCLETYLRCFCSESPRTWVKWVPWAEYWYNTTFHGSLGVTPFQAVYGRTPPPLLSFEASRTVNDTLDQQLSERDQALDVLKENLTRAQGRMKKYADEKRTE